MYTTARQRVAFLLYLLYNLRVNRESVTALWEGGRWKRA